MLLIKRFPTLNEKTTVSAAIATITTTSGDTTPSQSFLYPHLPPVDHYWALEAAPQRHSCWWWAQCSCTAAPARCCSGSASYRHCGNPDSSQGSDKTGDKRELSENNAINIFIIYSSMANTCAVQVLYWVNMASYKAIRPLCPAAAQARASNTGKDCDAINTTVVLYL